MNSKGAGGYSGAQSSRTSGLISEDLRGLRSRAVSSNQPPKGPAGIITRFWLRSVCRGQEGPPEGSLSQIDIQFPIAKNISEAKPLRIIKETRD